MKTIIHVNQHVIKANKKEGASNPPLTVKNYKRTMYGSTVTVHGPCTFVYSPDKPLKCGAHVWCETESPVSVYE